ncbi:C39 family peptidase [Bacillus sp. 31A1R]|uniref:C39 family peptidase n=1 Tax=Robertmurraya mangrovi TaxID=3098077 RepID=A0ABU5IZN2_9BACI|nr:C39 family peptidase [Bacillus sp. 31A1R]MDZ5472601.1 C39 family peptidase [Bacillus sp. 31A1R]
MLEKRTSLLKIFVLITGIILLILFVLLYQFSNGSYMTKTADSIKGWVQSSSVQQTNSKVEETVDLSVIKIKDRILIDAPVINQLPELPRGCEVTSLAMLLQYANVQVDKMTLAKEIKKDPTPYFVKEGKIYFGNPHDGFVGSMYTYDKPGLGVYHEPIKELADSYLPGQVLDLTGGKFKELKTHLSDGRPVWVIINTTYKKLSKQFFQTWHTPSGLVDVTFKEHSVLITGYDQDYVYFNDPLTGEKNKKAPKKDFEESWVQMGRQAITFLPR